jgi:hypothetical protein
MQTDGPSYFDRLTLDNVEACADTADALFQRDPNAISARRAAGWAELADRMRKSNAMVVADLGAEAAGRLEAELGFSSETSVADSLWPRDRASVEHGRPLEQR